MTTKSIGILGAGYDLPADVRSNDWWPSEFSSSWIETMRKLTSRTETDPEFEVTDGVRRTIVELNAHGQRGDAFFGVRERRVMPDSMSASQMEAAAAEMALKRAGIERSAIDLLLVSSMVPDFLTANNAAFVHDKLKLSGRCLALGADAICNSFLAQLQLASSMIKAGDARYALLVQSSAVSRILDAKDPFSAWCGDGAAAVVLGAVPQGFGVVGQAHRIDSRNCNGILTTGAGQPWYKGGHIAAAICDGVAARSTVFQTPDWGVAVLNQCFAASATTPADVAFFACHQANSQLRKVVQEMLAMDGAQYIDTFEWAGSLSGANIPLQLALAAERDLLAPGALVAMMSMGSGSTTSAALVRWGRG